MREISFRTKDKGNLPHLLYIFCKLKTLGTEFNTVACSVNRYFIFIEIHRGKDDKKNINLPSEAWGNSILEKEDDGRNKTDSSEGRKRGHTGLFYF